MKKLMNKLPIAMGLVAVFGMALSLFGFSGVAGAQEGLGTRNVIKATELGLEFGDYTGLAQGDVRMTVANIIRVMMQLLGIVAVCIVLIGGFKWMTAGGNDEQVVEAKKWIFSGVIGLALVLSAYAIAQFAVTSLVNAANSSGA